MVDKATVQEVHKSSLLFQQVVMSVVQTNVMIWGHDEAVPFVTIHYFMRSRRFALLC